MSRDILREYHTSLNLTLFFRIVNQYYMLFILEYIEFAIFAYRSNRQKDELLLLPIQYEKRDHQEVHGL